MAIANNKDSEKASKRSAIDCHLRPELGTLYLDEVRAGTIAELAAKLHKADNARGEGTIGPKTVKKTEIPSKSHVPSTSPIQPEESG